MRWLNEVRKCVMLILCHSALINSDRFVYFRLFDVIHPGYMVFSMMIYRVIAALPVDIDPCIRLEAKTLDVQLRVNLQRILCSGLRDYF